MAIEVKKKSWTCLLCGQRNVGWSTICGRCEMPDWGGRKRQTQAQGSLA